MSWQDERKQIRRQERLNRKEYKMAQQNLKGELAKSIPGYMMPGNVGSFTKVTWPFWYNVSFDFGANPSWSSNTRQTQSFQVSQEAAFLVSAISLKTHTYSTASALAPLQIELRDRQSTRQMNDRPIPLQMIGKRSHPTVLPTSMLLMPSAFFDVTMSSWLPVGLDQATTGNGKFQITFFGYRVRVEDADKVLSTVFG